MYHETFEWFSNQTEREAPSRWRRATARRTLAPAPASMPARARRPSLRCDEDVQSSARNCSRRNRCFSLKRKAPLQLRTSQRSAYGQTHRCRRAPLLAGHRYGRCSSLLSSQDIARFYRIPHHRVVDGVSSASLEAPVLAACAPAPQSCGRVGMYGHGPRPLRLQLRSSRSPAGTDGGRKVSSHLPSWNLLYHPQLQLRHLLTNYTTLFNNTLLLEYLSFDGP